MTVSTILDFGVSGFIIPQPHRQRPQSPSRTKLHMAPPNSSSSSSSLKPAAMPLMDSGKALARSGELLIDLTSSSLDLYGGSLSAAGAQIRNAGDCIAQAAASMRFKTGRELVYDEIREAATCLTEATDKLQQAIEEAKTDDNMKLVIAITNMVDDLCIAGRTLEEAGEYIMKQKSLLEIGIKIEQCGTSLKEFGLKILELTDDDGSDGKGEDDNGIVSSQRMDYAAMKMIEAGQELQGGVQKDKSKGKSWLKG